MSSKSEQEAVAALAPNRELDQEDLSILAEQPGFDRLHLDLLYVVRQNPGVTEGEILEQLVEMGWPRDFLEDPEPNCDTTVKRVQ